MAGKRSLLSALAAALGLSVAACSTLDVNHYCRYSQKFSLRDADPDSLALVLGISERRARSAPFVVVRSRSADNPGAEIKLQARLAAHPFPVGLDESGCARMDWRAYTLTPDADEWDAFWQDDRNASFEIFIAFLDGNERLLMSEFGAAIVDTTAAEHLVACGCYWK